MVNPEKPLFRPRILLIDVPLYEQPREEVDPIEIQEVSFEFVKFIQQEAPYLFDLATGQIAEDTLQTLGVTQPGFYGNLSVVVSHRAGIRSVNSISITHAEPSSNFWTEQFRYYADEFGEVRREDVRAHLFDTDDKDELLSDENTVDWDERDNSIAIGHELGINNMHVGLDELKTISKIVSVAIQNRFNTATRD